MKKNGFTLVELLAVIVILAVILVIAVPQINNVIKETRKNSLGSTAKLIAAKAEEKEVENDALERNESITCEDLVKLDDNYGNCTVTKNSTSGKWEVTIVGSGKFSGYTCTGTKDNMSCTERDTNTPEYVYSFDIPYYDYTYTVKDEPKCNTDLPGILRNVGAPEKWITSCVPRICSNSSDVYNEPEEPYSASEWFASAIQKGTITYEDISSFVEKGGRGELVNVVEDYAQLNKEVFIRWNGNETEFSNTSENSICTLYGGNLTCLETNASVYETNKSKLTTLFGSDKCEIDQLDEDVTYTYCEDGSWYCEASIVGIVECDAPGADCYVNADGSMACIVPGEDVVAE